MLACCFTGKTPANIRAKNESESNIGRIMKNWKAVPVVAFPVLKLEFEYPCSYVKSNYGGDGPKSQFRFQWNNYYVHNDYLLQTLEHFGGIDILVSNAAANPAFGPVLQVSHYTFQCL